MSMLSPVKNYSDCDYTRFFGKGCVQRCNYHHDITVVDTLKAAAANP